MTHHQPLRVLIAGGGVAGLESALALRELAGDRVSTTLLASDPEFVYRPMRVREPFGLAAARRYALDEIARDIGAEFRLDAFAALDEAERIVHTAGGDQLGYDALLLALGARPRPHFAHALTLDDRILDQQLHGLIQDIEGDYVHKLAFLIPPHMAWPLPIYELALMTAQRAWDMGVDVSVTIVTPEDAPLAIFGTAASKAVEGILEQREILTITGAHAETPTATDVLVRPGSRTLSVDRVIALPELRAPQLKGVPQVGEGRFVPVDRHARVRDLTDVYAAGDITDFAVKHGGIAAQQADAAAASIAALAGAPVERREFRPIIQGILLGGRKPLYMSAALTGGHGESSVVTDDPGSFPPTKIAANYLSPYLDTRDRAAVR